MVNNDMRVALAQALDALQNIIQSHDFGTTAVLPTLAREARDAISIAEAALAALSAERARCDVLTDDMLRHAMAAIGTGSPADADKFRRFWRFATEARNTGPNAV